MASTRAQRRAVKSVLVVLVMLLAAPVGAEAVSFGVNLDAHVANNTTTCAYPPFYPLATPYAQSCDIIAPGRPDGSDSLLVPLPDPRLKGGAVARGVVTQVRVKTGDIPNQAQAQLKIFMATRLGSEVACCTGAALSATFTLLPNHTTTVNTDLPVELRWNGQYTSFPILALALLDPNTPIPAEVTDPYAPLPYLSSLYGPGIAVGEERFVSGYSAPLLPMVSADVNVTDDGSPPPPPAQAGQARLETSSARVRRSQVRLPLSCPAATSGCQGRLSLWRKNKVISASADFNLAAAARGEVGVKLNALGRRLLKKSRRLAVKAKLTATGGNQSFSLRLER